MLSRVRVVPGTQRRIARERLYNSGMSPEIAARLRMDAPVLVIGIVVSFIGIGALFMLALRRRRTGHLLLWFSAFSILYGVRIVLDSVFAREVLGVPAAFRQWSVAFMTYVINIPSALLVRELIGEG